MTRLNRSLEDLARRGEPRGALDVFAAATTDVRFVTSPTRKATRPWAAFAGAFAGVLVVGTVAAALLGGLPGGTDARGPLVLQEDGAILLVAGPADGGEDAMVYGQLIVGEGGCLALSFEGDGATYPVVWPSGTRFASPEARAIEVPGAGTINLGAFVIAGGGYLSVPSDDPRLPAVPEACVASGSQVALVAPGSVRLEPTTTSVPEMATLPSAGSTPITVPQGAELEWFEFLPGSLHLAWRGTATGTEMCWRTVEGGGCVNDNFRAPDAVVIPYANTQVVVLTRAPFSGPAPERVVLELANGNSEVVPLFGRSDIGILHGLSDRLEGIPVLSAVAGDWPPLTCLPPPASELHVPTASFEMAVPTGPVIAGSTMELFIGSGPSSMTGVQTIWQCWDGSRWISSHVGDKVSSNVDLEPSVYRWEASPRWVSIGIAVPDTFTIRVPDLPPGFYRIEDQVGAAKGWIIVEIGN